MNSPRLHHRVSGAEIAGSEGEKAQGIQFAPGTKGWEVWAWDEKRYMIAREPGSVAVFDFVTSETESVAVDEDEEPMPDPIAEYEPHEHEHSAGRRRRTRREERTEGSGRKWEGKGGKARRQPDANSGTVAVGYQRSAHYGLGSVWCWVDGDREAGKRLDGFWEIKERNMGIVDKVATGLAPGPHRLQCELLEETLDPKGRREFRIFAIMHD